MLPPLPVPPATEVVTVLLCRSKSRPTASVMFPPLAVSVRASMSAWFKLSASAAAIEIGPPGPVPSLFVVTALRSRNTMLCARMLTAPPAPVEPGLAEL